MKVIYKITYPKGKICRQGPYRQHQLLWQCLQNRNSEGFTKDQRLDFTIRKEILWESESASDAEVSQMEVEYIIKLRSNDPSLGYNRWPKFRAG